MALVPNWWDPGHGVLKCCSPSEYNSGGDQSLSGPGDALHPDQVTVMVTLLEGSHAGGGMSCDGVSRLSSADESRKRDPVPGVGEQDL